ncbi:MAG: zf-HC2 domain-containing protein [Gemmatimonadaceae bacterium]
MSVYMPLDCDGFSSALADYLEGDASDAVRAAVEAHAEECAACAALLADLRAIPMQAAALPTLAPSRDLWSGIAERIDAPVLPLERPAARTIVPARRSWARPAIAAAALVIVTAGITHYMTRTIYLAPRTTAATSTTPPIAEAPGLNANAGPQVAVVTPPVPPSSGNGPGTTLGQPNAQRSGERTPVTVASDRVPSGRAGSSSTRLVSANSVMSETEPLYDREIAKLRTIVKSRRSALDPKTIAVLEQSIAVIDSAIAQSRSALAKDPASGFLANQLNHSLEKKVELLRTAAMLPART